MKSKFKATLVGDYQVLFVSDWIKFTASWGVARNRLMSVGAYKKLIKTGECECFLFNNSINHLLTHSDISNERT